MDWESLRALAAVVLVGIGMVFFLAGLVGLLRFPDVFTRIHALTKADTLGLGCVALGVGLLQTSLVSGLRVLLIWTLIALASGANGHFLCRAAYLDQRGRGEETP
ncbi:MAG: monovalent cation/H(+) antiporter subunit G [Gemmatimonadota bacterium]